MSPSQKVKGKEKGQSHSQQFLCPVCKPVLPHCDLPNKTGVITDNVYFEIVDIVTPKGGG
jgi:hypothetical protein